MVGSGQFNAEMGYGLPARRVVGTPNVGVETSQHGRHYRLGYPLRSWSRADPTSALTCWARGGRAP